jgi:hypothetical protein
MEVTLHVACMMPSLLEICFSAQQLYFVVEYSELHAATESLPHEKYFGSHGLHILPCYHFIGFLFSFLTMSQQGL